MRGARGLPGEDNPRTIWQPTDAALYSRGNHFRFLRLKVKQPETGLTEVVTILIRNESDLLAVRRNPRMQIHETFDWNRVGIGQSRSELVAHFAVSSLQVGLPFIVPVLTALARSLLESLIQGDRQRR